MTVYLDTSVVVPLFLNDDHAVRVRAWAKSAGPVVFSAWTATEFSSALSLQVRLNHLSVSERRDLEDAFDRWAKGGRILDFQPEYFEDARDLLRKNAKLRAPDALHLAIARHADLVLATLDGVLREAAVAEGLEVAAL